MYVIYVPISCGEREFSHGLIFTYVHEVSQPTNHTNSVEKRRKEKKKKKKKKREKAEEEEKEKQTGSVPR